MCLKVINYPLLNNIFFTTFKNIYFLHPTVCQQTIFCPKYIHWQVLLHDICFFCKYLFVLTYALDCTHMSVVKDTLSLNISPLYLFQKKNLVSDHKARPSHFDFLRTYRTWNFLIASLDMSVWIMIGKLRYLLIYQLHTFSVLKLSV